MPSSPMPAAVINNTAALITAIALRRCLGHHSSHCRRVAVLCRWLLPTFCPCLCHHFFAFWWLIVDFLPPPQLFALANSLLWAAKNVNRKKCQYFTLLCKLLAKPSYEHPPTMASTNYHSGTPLLPTMPFPDRNDSEWSWLILYASAPGGGHQGGRGMTAAPMVETCVWC